jgi:hypothetical protein
MVIDDLNVTRSQLSARPPEADALLPVDSDGILAGAVSAEGFKPVARQGPQRVERQRGVQDGKPPFGLLLESLERPDEFILTEPLGLFVPIAEDHSLRL